jgi:hypothetical protein
LLRSEATADSRLICLGVLHLVQLRESTGALVAIDRMVILRRQADHSSGGRDQGLRASGRVPKYVGFSAPTRHFRKSSNDFGV